MLVLCYCNVYPINPENADYVRDGKPLCNAETCRRVQANRLALRVPLASKDESNVAAG